MHQERRLGEEWTPPISDVAITIGGVPESFTANLTAQLGEMLSADNFTQILSSASNSTEATPSALLLATCVSADLSELCPPPVVDIAQLSAQDEVAAGGWLNVTFLVRDPTQSTRWYPPWVKLWGPQGFVTWCGFPVMASLLAGNEADGEWGISCRVPDRAVNNAYEYEFSGPWDWRNSLRGSFAVVGGEQDNQPPTVFNVSATPVTVSLGENVTVSYIASDASGIMTVFPWVFGPKGYEYGFEVYEASSPDDLERHFSFVYTAGSSTGAFHVFFSVVDRAGNRNFITDPWIPRFYVNSGLPT